MLFFLLSIQHNPDLGLNLRLRYDIPYLQYDLRLREDLNIVRNLDLIE